MQFSCSQTVTTFGGGGGAKKCRSVKNAIAELLFSLASQLVNGTAHRVFGEEEHIKMRTESKTINIKGHLFRFKCCHVRSLIFEYLNLKPI